MLTINVPAVEFFNEATEEFTQSEPVTLRMEHSLFSISKWEEKYEKPFLNKTEKTVEETIFYVQCMLLDGEVDDTVLNALTRENLTDINKYIDSKRTATWFPDTPTRRKRGEPIAAAEVMTSELIYYWLVSHKINFEVQYWHISRLLTLVKVCNEKNKPQKKMSNKENMAQHRAINEARRAQAQQRQ